LETGRVLFEAYYRIDLTNEDIIHQNQGGFRLGIGAYQQVVNLSSKIKELECRNLKIAFLDISKAYDNVERKILWKKMENKSNLVK
jgi:hypothetical protein